MCNDLCSIEFNTQISALKREEKKNMAFCSGKQCATGAVLPSRNAMETICPLLPITFLSLPVAGSTLPSICNIQAASCIGICKGEIMQLLKKLACSWAEKSMSILQKSYPNLSSEVTPLCFLLPWFGCTYLVANDIIKDYQVEQIR